MTTSSLVSLLSAVVSAVGALVAVLLSRRAVIRDRRLSADELAGRYRVPMLHAAFNLQSRLYNIGRQDFLARLFKTPCDCEEEKSASSVECVAVGSVGTAVVGMEYPPCLEVSDEPLDRCAVG